MRPRVAIHGEQIVEEGVETGQPGVAPVHPLVVAVVGRRDRVVPKPLGKDLQGRLDLARGRPCQVALCQPISNPCACNFNSHCKQAGVLGGLPGPEALRGVAARQANTTWSCASRNRPAASRRGATFSTVAKSVSSKMVKAKALPSGQAIFGAVGGSAVVFMVQPRSCWTRLLIEAASSP